MGLFKRLYKYKELQAKNQKENFLTEILAYCLNNDRTFKKNFFELLGLSNYPDDVDFATQYYNEQYGIFDIYFLKDDIIEIIIECKIEAKQGDNQIKKYLSKLAQSSSHNKLLAYITKYHEEIEIDNNDIQVIALKWHSIYDLITETITENLLTKELHTFLIEEKLSTKISFEKNQLNMLRNIKEQISKMDEFLSLVKLDLQSNYSIKTKQSKKLEDPSYGLQFEIKNTLFWLGFYEYSHNEETQLGLSIDIAKTAQDEQTLSKLNSLNWDSYDNGDKTTWYINSNLSEFFENEQFNSNKALEFININFKKIEFLYGQN